MSISVLETHWHSRLSGWDFPWDFFWGSHPKLQEAFREPFLDKTKKPWVWPTSQDEGLALGGLPGNPGGGGDHAQHIPRWWFRICSIFTAIFGEDDHFDEHIFQMGWIKPPTRTYISIPKMVGKMNFHFKLLGVWRKNCFPYWPGRHTWMNPPFTQRIRWGSSRSLKGQSLGIPGTPKSNLRRHIFGCLGNPGSLGRRCCCFS